jgi:hypothetical protein
VSGGRIRPEGIGLEDVTELDGSVDPSPAASWLHWLRSAAEAAAETGARVDVDEQAVAYLRGCDARDGDEWVDE